MNEDFALSSTFNGRYFNSLVMGLSVDWILEYFDIVIQVIQVIQVSQRQYSGLNTLSFSCNHIGTSNSGAIDQKIKAG